MNNSCIWWQCWAVCTEFLLLAFQLWCHSSEESCLSFLVGKGFKRTDL
jgi:hypothetical protein